MTPEDEINEFLRSTDIPPEDAKKFDGVRQDSSYFDDMILWPCQEGLIIKDIIKDIPQTADPEKVKSLIIKGTPQTGIYSEDVDAEHLVIVKKLIMDKNKSIAFGTRRQMSKSMKIFFINEQKDFIGEEKTFNVKFKYNRTYANVIGSLFVKTCNINTIKSQVEEKFPTLTGIDSITEI